MKYEEWFLKILENKEVQQQVKLHSLFCNSFAEYKKDYDVQIISRLVHDVSFYLMMNSYKAPQIVLDFMLLAEKEFAKSRGKGSFLKMLALSLSNMR